MALAITKENFQEVLSSELPVVIDFWAEWCGPCRMVAPIVDELATEYEGRVLIAKCDVEENDEITAKYGVRNIPTIIFLKGGELVDKRSAPHRRMRWSPRSKSCSKMLRSIAWHGMRAVEFSKGDYAALLVPDMGANLVRLADTRRGIEILRAPAGDEVEEFRRRPHVFGLPILFPPNRIADGQYTFDGRTYRFPITDAKGGHYHHGILKSQPFAVSKAWETADEVLVECRYYSNAGNDAIFRDFPHEFKCKIVYRLTARGLEQEVMFANRSKEPMPVGVGFHTPMRIPFAGGAAGDYVMRAAVGERVELSERNIPTGRKLPLSEKFARLRGAGLQVTDCDPIEAAFTVREIEVDGKPFRGALVENLRTGVRTCYEVDGQTTCWTIWNNGGKVPYCCPEPQSWTTNAPNMPDPEAEGFRSIAPGGTWSMKFRLYAK